VSIVHVRPLLSPRAVAQNYLIAFDGLPVIQAARSCSPTPSCAGIRRCSEVSCRANDPLHRVRSLQQIKPWRRLESRWLEDC